MTNRQSVRGGFRNGRAWCALVMVLSLCAPTQAQDGWSAATSRPDDTEPGGIDSATNPASPTASLATGPFAEQYSLPSGSVIVVEEGTGEPRSIGSYSLRLYAGQNPAFPLDDFRHGLVLPRDGFIETVQVVEPDMLAVVVRSAGTGGYLSGTLIRVRQELKVLGTLSGLPADARLIDQLRKLAGPRGEAN